MRITAANYFNLLCLDKKEKKQIKKISSQIENEDRIKLPSMKISELLYEM